MTTSASMAWREIAVLPTDRKDGRRLLLWDSDQPVIGRWDTSRDSWEDPESMQLFEEITHWADIDAPR